MNEITILCKVVDNFGDIGVVYRLARALCDIEPNLNITIICSDLKSFSAMEPNVNPQKKIQRIKYKNCEWTILDWNCTEKEIKNIHLTLPNFKNDFSLILECFQCGRPDWLEQILFAPENKKTYRIINIEYLTAEDYAEDFHCLKSGTRSIFVKKVNFMPGFTPKTGGLIIDDAFKNSLQKKQIRPNEFTVTIFSYERNFCQIFSALKTFEERHKKENPNFCVKVLAAHGKSLSFVKEAARKTGGTINVVELPFLTQTEWDKILCSADLNFIRGEDSLSRAALCSTPFVWQAYIQEQNYQLVKVEALLSKIKPFIKEKKTQNALVKLWQDYNTPQAPLCNSDLNTVLERTYDGTLRSSFGKFSRTLLKNKNMATALLEFINNFCKE